MAATSLHDDVFLDSEERHWGTPPPRFLFTVIRWWEWLRAWQERHRIGWDATDGRNGGAGRTVWETLLEMERFDCRPGEMDQG